MGFIKAKKPKNMAKPEDSVGGFAPLASDVYSGTVTAAYAVESKSEDSEALAVKLEVTLDTGRKVTNQVWVTGADGNVYSEYEGKKRYKAGYLLIDSLALIATEGEAGILDLETEEIIVKVKRDGNEVNEKVQSFFDLIGAKVQVGIISTTKYKQNFVDGEWIETEETITLPEISQIFSEDGFTLNELEAEAEEPEFINEWLKTWKGKTREPKAKEAPKGKRKNTSEEGKPASRAATRRSIVRR